MTLEGLTPQDYCKTIVIKTMWEFCDLNMWNRKGSPEINTDKGAFSKGNLMETGQSFQYMMPEQLYIHVQKKKISLDTDTKSFTKINSK